jgi:hypothetical protein
MPHKSVLFLDFDGVINSDHTLHTWRSRGFAQPLEPKLMQRVGTLVRETKSDVVISSAWRAIFPIHELRDLLVPHIPREVIVGRTPQGGVRVPRGEEIAAWLDSHRDYTRVAVLDDNDWGPFGMDRVRPWFVQTNEHTGVSDLDIARARQLLGPSGRVYRPLEVQEAVA